MTVGRGISNTSACSARSPCSRISARSFSTRTAARRTVQTLIASYDAFSTKPRPFDPPRCDRASGSAGAGAGSGVPGPTSGADAWATATVRPVYRQGRARPPVSGRGVAPQNLQRLDALPQRLERGRHLVVVGRPLEVGEEHVVAKLHAPRPRLDLRQVDRAVGELAQHADERPGRLVVEAPEHDGGLGGGPSREVGGAA